MKTGDHVLYLSSNNALNGRLQKGIWKIVEYCASEDTVKVENILTKDSFVTVPEKLKRVADLVYKYGKQTVIDNVNPKAWERYLEVTKIYKNPCSETFLTDDYYMANPYVRKTELKGEWKMNSKTKIVDNNVNAAKIAARITAGKTLNKVVMEKVRPQLPMMARGYADHPLGTVVVANIAKFVVDNFVKNNDKATYAADAMMEAAMVDFLATFNLEKVISDVLSGVEIPTEEIE